MPKLDYDILSEMRRKNSAWRLLLADNSPLIISFLNNVFIVPNVRVMPESSLSERLDDELYFLREARGPELFKRPAADYLKEWAEADKGWLRRFYPKDSDEPHYDLTPSAEKVISWVVSLSGSSFIGTESRLKIIFDLLRQMVEGSEVDPEIRVAELRKRRDDIDLEIAKIEGGEIPLLDSSALKDRFQQFSNMAMDLLSDFRMVEYNFRALDRNVRERIAMWDRGKGALLDEILNQRDAIAESEQGRSFAAFMDFLLSFNSQRELDELLGRVMEMPSVIEMMPDVSLRRIYKLWFTASKHVQGVAAALSSQLRWFIDNSVWLENRRIVEIFQKIQEHALQLRDKPPQGSFMEIDETGIDINLMMERPMFSTRAKTVISSQDILHGDESGIDISALFEQNYVDIPLLRERIERALRHEPQVTLGELLVQYPLEKGLAEVLAYMSIASGMSGSIFDDSSTEELEWENELGNMVDAVIPRVIFTR
ncbi:MAG: DUF3375 domain-containing protein [Synergistaceae bacterium]|jgi:hypothetical protein|nr:DUF3375 domain-containing protein [Synergistaceae bacterium]